MTRELILVRHGETLHNHYHGNRLESGQLFILDAGAETELVFTVHRDGRPVTDIQPA